MVNLPLKIEISLDVIVHATEDVTTVFQAFEDVLGVKEESFVVEEAEGHYENPILLLKATIVKKEARNLMKVLLEKISKEQIGELVDEIKERTVDSRFHVRLDKQELVKGNLIVSQKDTVKLKVHTPIYNKRDTVKVFTKIFEGGE